MGLLEEKFIARHILEIRFKNKDMSFIDFKGQLLNQIIEKTHFDKFSLQNTKIDVANSNVDEVVFYSWESFGIQLEATSDFEIFKRKTRYYLDIIKEFEGFKIDNISRIGVKSSIYCNPRGLGFSDIQKRFKDLMFTSYSSLEQESKMKIQDIGFFTIEGKIDPDLSVNITTGPVTHEEVVVKWFNNNKHYTEFNKQNGIYYDIDVFENKEFNFTDFEELKSKVIKNIEKSEENFDSFGNYFNSIRK